MLYIATKGNEAMPSVFKMAFAFIFVCSLGFAAGTAANAQESYTIGPGDKLGVTFLSNSSFDRVVKVGIDGSINLPLLGALNVRGQTIKDLRAQIPNLMTGAVYRERVGGEYLLVSIEPEEVMIDVVEYRPVYFDGSVRRPGQQSFEIGMTVRQGIAAAEGLATIEDRSTGGSDLRNHPRVLMANLIGILAEIAVHEAILAGKDELDLSQLRELNAPSEVIDQAIGLARSQVETSTEILSEEAAFLDTSVEEAEARVIAALRHEEAMTAIAESEETEVERIESLVARRIVSSEQLTTTRRLFLQAIERLGNVQAERLSAEASRRQLVLERNQAMRERALQIQARLQELSQQAAQLRVRIELSSAFQTTLALDESPETAPSIVIFRQTGGHFQEIIAQPETPLLPGDVVNVSLRE
jgi:polysaccharide export outer membrane protein